jgi:uncharacterized protein Yka (UPF0111/DUF47 family)
MPTAQRLINLHEVRNPPLGLVPQEIVLDPGTIAAILGLIGNLLDSLFGSGHAGSCGVFRKAALDFINKMAPSAQQLHDIVNTLASNPTEPPEKWLQPFYDAMLAAYQTIDSGFDEFKGSNLLGQTMYAVRTLTWFVFHYMAEFDRFSVIAMGAKFAYLLNLIKQIQPIDPNNPIIKNLQRQINFLNDRVNDLSKLLDKRFNLLQSEVTDLLKKYGDLSNIVKKLNDANFQGQINNLKNLYNNLNTWTHQKIQAVIDYIANVRDDLAAAIRNVFNKVEQDLALTAANIIKAFEEGDKNTLSKALDAVAALGAGLQLQINDLRKQIQNVLEKEINDIKNLKDYLNEQLSERLGPLEQQILDILNKIAPYAVIIPQILNDLDHIHKVDLPRFRDDACQCAYDKARDYVDSALRCDNLLERLCECTQIDDPHIKELLDCLRGNVPKPPEEILPDNYTEHGYGRVRLQDAQIKTV